MTSVRYSPRPVEAREYESIWASRIIPVIVTVHSRKPRPTHRPDTADVEDFSYRRVERLVGLLRGDRASSFAGTEGIEEFSDHVQPHAAGPAERVWYGAASLGSARWTGQAGLSLLTSSVVKVENDHPADGLFDFAAIQHAQITAFRAAHPGAAARVSQGLVVVPTDTATAEQRARYAAYVTTPHPAHRGTAGPGRGCCSPRPDRHLGRDRRAALRHAGFQEVGEVVFALPFGFDAADYVQHGAVRAVGLDDVRRRDHGGLPSSWRRVTCTASGSARLVAQHLLDVRAERSGRVIVVVAEITRAATGCRSVS
jgi:hypothetical protein